MHTDRSQKKKFALYTDLQESTHSCKESDIHSSLLNFFIVPFSTVHVKWFPLSALWN